MDELFQNDAVTMKRPDLTDDLAVISNINDCNLAYSRALRAESAALRAFSQAQRDRGTDLRQPARSFIRTVGDRVEGRPA